MAKKVVPYSRPVIDKLSIKLTETYILTFVKDASTFIQTLIVKGCPESFLLLPGINALLLVKNLIKPVAWAISHHKDRNYEPVCHLEFWCRPFKLAKFHRNRRDSV